MVSIVYVPVVPVPVPRALIVPFPVPTLNIVIPVATVPLNTPATVRVFAAEIVPYTTASPVTAARAVGVGGGQK